MFVLVIFDWDSRIGCPRMKLYFLATFISLSLLPFHPATAQPVSTQVYFSPHGGCTEAVVDAINTAKTTILVQAYSFTSVPIAQALVNAKHRGVEVLVILDKSQRRERKSSADFVVHEGIPTWIDEKPTIAHNKVVVIDSHMVVTGSFNFTKAAEEKNTENLLVIDDPELAVKYTKNWKARQGCSVLYGVNENDEPTTRRFDHP